MSRPSPAAPTRSAATAGRSVPSRGRVSQHALRSDRGAGRTPRSVNTSDHQARLAVRLTARDRWLIRMLLEHRVLTSSQIQAAAFPSARAANTRLLELYRWRVLDRFQPFRTTGSAPMHYVLDTAGAAVLAAEAGLDPKALGYRHERALGVAHSLHLAHTIGRNEFFAALIAIARHSAHRQGGGGGRALTTWWGEARCAALFGDLVRPDGYARWREDHPGGMRQVEFFLEFDTGTENLTQLAGKLVGYHALAAATGIATPVLFWLPTLRRESAARRALADTLARLPRPGLVPVATSAADLTDLTGHTTFDERRGPAAPTSPPAYADRQGRAPGASPALDSPAGARWLPLDPAGGPARGGAPWGRVRLAALGERWPGANAHRPATTGTPAAPTSPAGGRTRRDGLPAPDPMPPDVSGGPPRWATGAGAVGA